MLTLPFDFVIYNDLDDWFPVICAGSNDDKSHNFKEILIITDWFNQNNIEYDNWIWNGSKYFYFKNEIDAILFKLGWL